MTQEKTKRISLTRFFSENEGMLGLYMRTLARMMVGHATYPRVVRIVPADEEGNWRIADIVPASPDFLPQGLLSVKEILRGTAKGHETTINAFVMVLRKSHESNQLAFMLMLGNPEGDFTAFGRVEGQDWVEVDESTLDGMLIKLGEDSDEDSPRYGATVRRIRRRLSETVPETTLSQEQCRALADACLREALPLARVQLSDVLDEAHMAGLSTMDAIGLKAAEIHGVVQRALKGKEKQYNRLFRDYEKVQLQAKGFQNRIGQLQAELKKVGQRKAMPGSSGVNEAHSATLAERLDGLL